MFEKLELAPPDAILGLTEAFKNDPNPDKINLSVGIYKDQTGQTPIFSAVKKAEHRILGTETGKSYLPIVGSPEFAAVAQEFTFGHDHEIIASKRATSAQTPGGTGALRIAGMFLKKVRPNAKMWVSDPTWANHKGIFGDAGLEIATYPYYNAAEKSLNFPAMIAALENIPAGDIVLLHSCCHNPTGVDPSPDQWQQIAKVLSDKNILPLMDFAYQGFGNGIDTDAIGVRTVCQTVPEALIANSFSKNFGLYNERVGGLTAICPNAETAAKVKSHVAICIRRNYSNPPAHGGAIVTTVWNDPELRNEWETELTDVRSRIQQMRSDLVSTLKAKGVFSWISPLNS
jgi:aspartate/tyrosine/aromatic aminotransferase